MKYKLQKVLNIVRCSSNFESKKRTDQNFITQNPHHVKDYRILKKKKLLKQRHKDCWVVLGGGGYILVWRVVADIFWLVVDGSGWWWVVVSGCRWWYSVV